MDATERFYKIEQTPRNRGVVSVHDFRAGYYILEIPYSDDRELLMDILKIWTDSHLHGYAHLLDVLRDPTNEEYEDISDWVSPDFDSEAFDLDEANEILRQIR